MNEGREAEVAGKRGQGMQLLIIVFGMITVGATPGHTQGLRMALIL